MKTKEEMLANLMACLTELQEDRIPQYLRPNLVIELTLLYEILGEDVPEEYWDEIEEIIY